MASIQRGPRRLSARLQEKDEVQPNTNGAYVNPKSGGYIKGISASVSEPAPANNKKRKNDYNEEDNGFMFARVKKRKPRASTSKTLSVVNAPNTERSPPLSRPTSPPVDEDDRAERVKRQRKKMSFSTPGRKEEQRVRRSKRLSAEDEEFYAKSKADKSLRELQSNGTAIEMQKQREQETPLQSERQEKTPTPATESLEMPGDNHSGTKISLPFSDTPVIRRNKAMREGKANKGERRSSLGLRGRRASSLIDTGNSNGTRHPKLRSSPSKPAKHCGEGLTLDTALPHHEVEIPDFYKHIECEGLPEPRRMRQLLTWCATRALGEKSKGSKFEDQSARMAARVIQEELLKDLANRSEMSDWFSREDIPAHSTPLPTRPNPKNAQNEDKIKELEEQIRRLRAERDSLDSLSQSPVIVPTADLLPSSDPEMLDRSLLSPSDTALLGSLQASSTRSNDVQCRLGAISCAIGPIVDSFADGMHAIGQYRNAAENVAGRALAICADKLAEKENASRSQTRPEGGQSHGTELENVLRGLSRVER